jgi:hypothetical protein
VLEAIVVDIQWISGHLNKHQWKVGTSGFQKVDVHMLPWFFWPRPRSITGWWLDFLTWSAWFTQCFNFLIKWRPPQMNTCQRFHLWHAHVRLLCCNLFGITTLIPHSRHRSSIVNSFLLLKYGFNSEPISDVGHPNLVYFIIRLRTVSVDWSFSTVTGRASIWWKWKTDGSFEISFEHSETGSLGSTSALPCWCVDLYWIS